MNAKQKQEVIKMYAETIEAENDIKTAPGKSKS